MNMTNKSKYQMKHAVCLIWSIFGLDLLDRFHISRDVDMTIPEKKFNSVQSTYYKVCQKNKTSFSKLISYIAVEIVSRGNIFSVQ